MLSRFLKVAVVIGLIVGGVFAVSAYRMIFTPNTAFEEQEVYVYIPTGFTYPQLQEKLSVLVSDVEALNFVAERKGYADRVRPGRYRLKKGMNNNDIINTLRSNNLAVNVTFNNQETIELLAGRIARRGRRCARGGGLEPDG